MLQEVDDAQCPVRTNLYPSVDKTENIASRVSHLSQGNDVVLGEETLAEQETHVEAVQHGGIEAFEADLYG